MSYLIKQKCPEGKTNYEFKNDKLLCNNSIVCLDMTRVDKQKFQKSVSQIFRYHIEVPLDQISASYAANKQQRNDWTNLNVFNGR